MGLALLLACGPATLIGREVRDAEVDPALHVSKERLALPEVLEELPPGRVMSSVWGGMLVPWRTGKAVFAGHWYLSYELPQRRAVIRALFSPKTPLDVKQKTLVEADIDYVLEDRWTLQEGVLHPALVAEIPFANGAGRVVRVARPR